jgi:dihydroneopterin aldolase
MNTIHIKNLEFWGTHGVTGDEKEVRQLFGIDIAAHYDFAPAIKSDALADAIDYKILEQAARKEIEGSHRVLIETVAHNIIEQIFIETQASAVDVSLSKLRAKSSGTPSVSLSRQREIKDTGSASSMLNITAEKVRQFYDAKTDGVLHLKGVLYDFLDKEKVRDWYNKKAETFEKKEEKYIQNNQEVSVVANVPFGAMQSFSNPQEAALHNLYYKIRKEIAKHSAVPLKQGDRLETKLIKYPVSTLGVGAHKDLSSNINFITVMNLYGTTMFYTSSDKNRSDEIGYKVEPGDIVIMRGPRNASENDLRPIHYVLDIQEERLVFVCREIEDASEAIINKGNWMGF